MNKYLVLCVILQLTLFINSVYSVTTIKTKYDDDSAKTIYFNIKQGFQLLCDVSSDAEVELEWQKEGVPISDVKGLKGRVTSGHQGSAYTLNVKNSHDEDQGNYTCVVVNLQDKLSYVGPYNVKARIAIKVPNNVNVVEGEGLKIHCNVIGTPKLIWHYKNDTYNETYTETLGRIEISQDPDKQVDNAILEIKSVEMSDRGEYTCIGTADGVEVNSTCMVRIKDQYAALWPFLGICAEVFILCAIIFIYEKKRNKTELEESDTDQSPDQKNTPDHGKDANLRHRQ